MGAGGTEVSLEPAESWLPLAHNNSHSTEAHLRKTHSEPLQLQPSTPKFLFCNPCLCFFEWVRSIASSSLGTGSSSISLVSLQNVSKTFAIWMGF